jgi:hypothetical protein
MRQAQHTPDDLVDAPPQEWLDGAWRFRMKLPRAWHASPGSTLLPRAHEVTLLARYERDDPPAKLEVFGTLLEREVDAGDWLTHSYMLAGKTIERVAEPTRTAKVADVEATWGSDDTIRAGRFHATKQGSRMYLLICSTDAKHRDQLASLSAACAASFEPEKGADVSFSEVMRPHKAKTPVPWQMLLPASWIVEYGSSGEDVASLQAENIRRGDDDPGETVGKLAFAVLSRSAGKTPRDVAELYLSAVRDNGLDIGYENVSLEVARKPFSQSWYLVAPVAHEDLPGELRCRVMCHDDVWVLAGLLGLTRETNLQAWMQNKRALDVVTFGLKFKASSNKRLTPSDGAEHGPTTI